MAAACSSVPDVSSLSLYKLKSSLKSSSILSDQNERRQSILIRQKEKRDELVSQLRLASIVEDDKPRWPPRQSQQRTSPIGMMLAEWLFSPPEDLPTWFIIPCPRGQRCLVVVQSHRTHIFGKNENFMWSMSTRLPKQTILFCIYDKRSGIYHIIDVIMWHGQDYSTQIESQCRFYMLTSLQDDPRLGEQFQILPRIQLNTNNQLPDAEDGYLFYHPFGFYEPGYSPLVCWLKPFMIEEIIGIQIHHSIEKPDGYTTASDYMLDEQAHRNEQQTKIRKKKTSKKQKEQENDEAMIMPVNDE